MSASSVELKLYGRTVHTVFDLLGEKEDDITYSLGWGLAQSERLAHSLLGEAFDGELAPINAVLLQHADKTTGRTDVEVQTQNEHLIVEAKRGWGLPPEGQLEQYARRLARDAGDRRKTILVVAECAQHFPPVQELPRELHGVPVLYRSWSQVAQLVAATATGSRNHAEKRLLGELNRYLRRLMTSQDVTSNTVYVVSLNHDQLPFSELTFVQTVMERDRYYHPAGGGKWPKTPANYLGFRYDGQLQRVSFVEDYEVTTRPHQLIPEIDDETWEPHFVYTLGPPLPLPDRPVKSTGMWSRHARVALDLLLTSPSIREAEQSTAARLAKAGEGG